MISQFIAAMLGVWAFAVLFYAPRKYYPACSFCGAVGWICYLVLTKAGVDHVLSAALSCIVLTILSRAIAVLMKAPATVFLVTGIFPLVPGAGIYYASYYLMGQDLAMGGQKAIEVLSFAGAIAVGILVGSLIPQKFFSKVFGFFSR